MEAFDHARYIRSSSWLSRRERYFSTHPKICAACGLNELIHLHHKTYRHIKAEPDEDLVPLCENCHSLVHQSHRTDPHKRSLWRITDIVINTIQASRRGEREAAARLEDRRKSRSSVATKTFELKTSKGNRRRGRHRSPLDLQLVERLAQLSDEDLTRLYKKMFGNGSKNRKNMESHLARHEADRRKKIGSS